MDRCLDGWLDGQMDRGEDRSKAMIILDSVRVD